MRSATTAARTSSRSPSQRRRRYSAGPLAADPADHLVGADAGGLELGGEVGGELARADHRDPGPQPSSSLRLDPGPERHHEPGAEDHRARSRRARAGPRRRPSADQPGERRADDRRGEAEDRPGSPASGAAAAARARSPGSRAAPQTKTITPSPKLSRWRVGDQPGRQRRGEPQRDQVDHPLRLQRAQAAARAGKRGAELGRGQPATPALAAAAPERGATDAVGVRTARERTTSCIPRSTLNMCDQTYLCHRCGRLPCARPAAGAPIDCRAAQRADRYPRCTDAAQPVNGHRIELPGRCMHYLKPGMLDSAATPGGYRRVRMRSANEDHRRRRPGSGAVGL